MDHYLVLADPGSREVAAIVVEEFVLAGDHTTTGIRNAVWTPDRDGWWSAPDLSRQLRADPTLRSRLVAVTRDEAARRYAPDPGRLPDEATLRGYLGEPLPLATAAPLSLHPGEVPDGFRERRVYRILFAGAPDDGQLAGLRELLRMDDPRSRVAGTAGMAGHRLGGDLYTWELRRIGADLGWAVDVTALLAGDSDATVGPLLADLRAAARRYGLVPVTVERFA